TGISSASARRWKATWTPPSSEFRGRSASVRVWTWNRCRPGHPGRRHRAPPGGSAGQARVVFGAETLPCVPEGRAVVTAEARGKHVEVRVPAGADHDPGRPLGNPGMDERQMHPVALGNEVDGDLSRFAPGEDEAVRRLHLDDAAFHAVLGREPIGPRTGWRGQ